MCRPVFIDATNLSVGPTAPPCERHDSGLGDVGLDTGSLLGPADPQGSAFGGGSRRDRETMLDVLQAFREQEDQVHLFGCLRRGSDTAAKFHVCGQGGTEDRLQARRPVELKDAVTGFHFQLLPHLFGTAFRIGHCGLRSSHRILHGPSHLTPRGEDGVGKHGAGHFHLVIGPTDENERHMCGGLGGAEPMPHRAPMRRQSFQADDHRIQKFLLETAESGPTFFRVDLDRMPGFLQKGDAVLRFGGSPMHHKQLGHASRIAVGVVDLLR